MSLEPKERADLICVEIVANRIDIASSWIAILRTVASSTLLFMALLLVGVVLGEDALGQVAGKANAGLLTNVGFISASLVFFFVVVISISAVTLYTYYGSNE